MSDHSSVYTAYLGNTYLFGGNAPYVEEMYENYLANPGSVPDHWREYFDALQNVPAVDGSNAKDVPHLPVVNAFAQRAKQGGTRVVVAAGADLELARKRTAVQQLIAAYRNVGARWADLDPLKRDVRENIPSWSRPSTASATPTRKRCSTPAIPSSAKRACRCAS